jgi:predicted ATPase/DNA-binding SARP family transcriptional activator
MRFGILGPLEVADDGGRRVGLGGHKQRSVLAVLLLHANEAVSPDRLVEDLWPGGPPASAATSLQAHVSRLRRALGDGPRIVTAGGGYVIRVAPGELDLERFERLVEEGGVAISTEDWELAAGKLREALGLWRGPPLSDFQYDSFAQAEIARLAELHVAALEQRIDADLALDDGAAVVGELERLVREHPYRERLRGQLMLALYRTGRQTDALAAYRGLSGVLRDELGLEPGESLRELERAILRHDPALSTPAGAECSQGSGRATVAAPLPAGTVTFLFTDVEGSTRLLGELGSVRYSEELGRHRELVRQAVANHGGSVLGTEGDAFFVAFARASDALATASEVHAALADGAVRVRIGVHTGEPLLVDGDYVGLDVHKAARICGAAHGGQVVVSQTTRDIAGLELRDLGLYRLKDLDVPERLYQLGANDFPPLRTVSATNLPVQLTPFLGRVDELAAVSALLRGAGTRLVTLTGAGGSGKTRLALQAALGWAEGHPDGALFVGFADLTDPGLIALAICQAIGLGEQPDVTPTQRLEGYLCDREVLLVLDNLEQLISGVGVLGELLTRCPGVRMLVTSREPLHLAGEQRYEVPVLEPGDAIELFCARAKTVAPDLAIDREAAGGICERLDRLPLAIELAAARTRVLSSTELLARLERHLPVLAAGPRDAPRRQHTLQATIDWSYELLTSEEQQLFARLSVFAGGCTLEAAEAVADAELDTVEALVDRCLVRVGDGRYSMLQTLSEYALEKLARSGEEDHLRRRHAHWLVELLHARGLDTSAYLDMGMMHVVLEAERENFRAALEWAERAGEIETVARLAMPVTWLWCGEGSLSEADRWLGVVRERSVDFPPALQARVGKAARELAWARGAHQEAADLSEQALALYRELGDVEAIVMETSSLAASYVHLGDLARGRALLTDAIQLAREHELNRWLPGSLVNLADTEIAEGALDQARALCEEALTLAPGVDPAGMVARINLAHIANLERRHVDAAELAQEALNGSVGIGSLSAAAAAALMLAWSLAELQQTERSARLLGAALEFFRHTGTGIQWSGTACEQAARDALCAQLDDRTLHVLVDQGRTMTLEQIARKESHGAEQRA